MGEGVREIVLSAELFRTYFFPFSAFALCTLHFALNPVEVIFPFATQETWGYPLPQEIGREKCG